MTNEWKDPPAPVSHKADWDAFKAAIAPVETIDEPALVKQKSRDFYWYSPVLKRQLGKHFGDLVVIPKSEEEVIKVASECAKRRIPLTVRGAGTGNYGQAMPLAGGVVLDMTAMDKIVSLDKGTLKVQPGMKLIDLEAQTLPQGWEMRFHPSTRRTATIGGFIAGGSGGIGSINFGVLRDRGNVKALRVVTVEEAPRIVTLVGDDAQKVVHAYGTNGIVTELEIAMARAWPWTDCVASFPDFMASVRFAQALCEADAIVKKEVAPIAWGAAKYFKPLLGHLKEGEHIVCRPSRSTRPSPICRPCFRRRSTWRWSRSSTSSSATRFRCISNSCGLAAKSRVSACSSCATPRKSAWLKSSPPTKPQVRRSSIRTPICSKTAACAWSTKRSTNSSARPILSAS